MHHLKLLGLALTLGVSYSVLADDHQAEVNYMLHCQGCHTPDGSGFVARGIPSFKGFMGKFLRVPGGREFLIQVPGASQSLLNSRDLAEMTNWMLRQFDPESIADGFMHYTEEEVERLRKKKLIAVKEIREELISHIDHDDALD